jgi:NADH:ubiquinone oxidoreductase subunit 2 (subunit N)
MQMSPLTPILCLLAGEVLIGLSALVRFRWPTAIMVVSTGLAAASMLPLAQQLPATVVALDWRPVTLLGSAVSLRVDTTAWLFGMALLIAGFAVSLTWLVVPAQGQPAPSSLSRALVLAMLAVGLASVFAANILTLAIAWGMLDALFCLTLLARGGPTSGRRAQLVLGLNGLATLSVWLVVVLIEQDHLSPYWHLLILPANARILMALAAALRLGLYPLHLWQPVELVSELDRAILIYLVPAAAGLALWVRLAVMQGLPEGNLWPTIALATALIGGVQAWLQPDPRESLPHLALGYGGVLILAATGARIPAMALVAGSAGWLLGLTLLFMGRPFARATWLWASLSTLGVAALAGLPLTVGFVGRLALYQGLLSSPAWVLVTAMLAETLLIGAMLRRVIMPEAESLMPTSVPARIAYAVALAVAAAPLLVTTVVRWPEAQPFAGLSTTVWIAWGIPLAVAVIMAVLVTRLGHRVGRWGKMAGQVIRLEWLYSVLLPVFHGPARVGLLLADLLEGDGAFLWMLVILALVLLYVRR